MPTYPDNSRLPEPAERVYAYVRTRALWQPGAHLLVAVSGGPDSVALLDMLAALPDAGLRLAVAHIHHHLRAEADEDAAFVEALTARYQLPFHLCHADVPARVAETGESVEEAAREIRYAALQALAEETGADRVVTGHTADDQAETVLMRILRGAGLSGLAGIPPQRDCIVRPLLDVWRAEILAYCTARELTFRTDLSNYSTVFTRNRIRLDLLPQLEAQYAPRLRVRLHHLAEMARQDAQALDGWADDEYTRQRTRLPDGVALPDALALPAAIVWRLRRLAITEVRGSLEGIGYDHLADIDCLPVGRQVHLPGVRVLHEGARLVFLPSPADEALPFVIPEQPLPFPGRLCLPDAGCCLIVEWHEGRLPVAGGDVAVLDAAAVHLPLRLRSWRPGDRYRPLGAPGTRKLQDIFVDAGVPRRLRTKIPVLLDGESIVWVAGFRIADRVKMTPETAISLRFCIEWELNPWTVKPSETW